MKTNILGLYMSKSILSPSEKAWTFLKQEIMPEEPEHGYDLTQVMEPQDVEAALNFSQNMSPEMQQAALAFQDLNGHFN